MQQIMAQARVLVLVSALCFATTGTAQALGPHAAPAAVGAARVAVGGALLVLVASRLVPRARAAGAARPALVGPAGRGASPPALFPPPPVPRGAGRGCPAPGPGPRL